MFGSYYYCVALAILSTTGCKEQTHKESTQRTISIEKSNIIETTLLKLRESDEDGDRTVLYERNLRVRFGQPSLGALSDHDLSSLHEAANLVAFYSFEVRHIEDLRRTVTELERRRRATDQHYVNLQQRLIAVRDLTQANTLAIQHPERNLPLSPHIRDAEDLDKNRPTQLIVSDTEDELLRRNVDISGDTKIIIVAHPGCHFSNDAVVDIERDPRLLEALADATWIAPADGRLNLDQFRRWNAEHPWLEQSFVFANREWPMIEVWATPIFQHGVRVATLSGWSADGDSKAKLVTALQKVRKL